MYQLTFTLKQHTPFIHFQHDQDGATLRATEVKPKLDRFIIEKLTEKTGDEALKLFRLNTTKKILRGSYLIDNPNFNLEWCSMLIGGKNDHLALNYKMRIEGIGVNKFEDLIGLKKETKRNKHGEEFDSLVSNTLPTFFGNMMKLDDFEAGVPFKKISFYNTLHLTIRTFNEGIYNQVNELSQDFFLVNNFGTRQTKGFGSFTIINTSEKPLPILKIPECALSFKSDYKYGDFQLLFTEIDLLYRSWRSGINLKKPANYDFDIDNKLEIIPPHESRFYFKSALFLFLKTKGLQWDKKTIKDTFFTTIPVKRKPSKSEQNEFKLKHNERIKELNMAEQMTLTKNNQNTYDILHYIQEGNEDVKFYKEHFGLSSEENWKSYGVTIKRTIESVDRFKSPIMFKPICTDGVMTVYVLFENQRLPLTGENLTVANGVKTITNNMGTIAFNDFFIFIKDKTKFNIDHHIEQKYQKKSIPEYTILKKLYTDIQK